MTAAEAGMATPTWYSEYPPGVPHEISLDAYSSLVDLFERSCKQFADRVAYECMGAKLSFAELEEQSRAVASWLQNVLGLSRGDRVAIMMPNLLQYPVAMFGILRAGMVVVNVNPLYTPRELEHQLRDSGARAIFINENFCTTLEAVTSKVKLDAVVTTKVGDLHPFPKSVVVNFVVKHVKKMVPNWTIPGSVSLAQVYARGRRAGYTPVAVTLEDTAFLQYTGGTTGLSKGAQLLHRNILANVLQMLAWVNPAINANDPEQDIVITPLPLYHVYALTVNCLMMLPLGAKNVLITNPRDLPALVKELKAQPFTAFTGVNTLFNGLANTPGISEVDFSRVKFFGGGGAAILKATAQNWKSITGMGIAEGYGLTETSPVVSSQPCDRLEWNGTIGVPIPSTFVSLRDEENNEVPTGSAGELCVKGPQVMVGYWNRPEDNAKTFTPDGWLRTGDIAVFDERGYLRIVDRKKDMIIVSGFNVYPNEIEDLVSQHPGVLECACIGVPDDKTGEAVKVFVVRKDPSLTVEQVRSHCKSVMTGYKVPRHVEFRDQLPKSNIGKILRKELRDKPADAK